MIFQMLKQQAVGDYSDSMLLETTGGQAVISITNADGSPPEAMRKIALHSAELRAWSAACEQAAVELESRDLMIKATLCRPSE